MENDTYTPQEGESWETGIPPYSEVEMERLMQYDHMIRLIDDSEDKLRDGQPVRYVLNYDDKSRKPTFLFVVDRYFIDGMRHAASSLRQEVSEKPHMADAILDIEQKYFEEKQLAEEFEIAELNRMFDIDA